MYEKLVNAVNGYLEAFDGTDYSLLEERRAQLRTVVAAIPEPEAKPAPLGKDYDEMTLVELEGPDPLPEHPARSEDEKTMCGKLLKTIPVVLDLHPSKEHVEVDDYGWPMTPVASKPAPSAGKSVRVHCPAAHEEMCRIAGRTQLAMDKPAPSKDEGEEWGRRLFAIRTGLTTIRQWRALEEPSREGYRQAALRFRAEILAGGKPRVSDEELAAIGYETADAPAKYEDAGPMVKHIWLAGARAIRAKLGA